MIIKYCLYCGDSFEVTRPNKVYCSEKCGKKFSAKRTGSKRRRRDRWKRPWIKFKKGYCESCGFIPQHSCQLEVDHINGIKSDNRPENLQTLCANCHRLKTYMNEDWKEKTPVRGLR